MHANNSSLKPSDTTEEIKARKPQMDADERRFAVAGISNL
jgi:hypothetical protein